MTRKPLVFVIICLFFLVFLVPGISGNEIIKNANSYKNQIGPLNQGETITVDDDLQQCPDADFTDLHDAIEYFNDYNPSATGMDVYPGEYKITSSNDMHSIFENDLYLRGVEGAFKTTIYGNAIGTALVIYGNNIEVSGFTIKNNGMYNGLRIGGDTSGSPDNIKIHDNIFYLNNCFSDTYGVKLTGQYSNVEVYNNDFISDDEDQEGKEKNAKDSEETGYWHDNFWRDWDGIWDQGAQGVPYESNGVYDPSPRWDPIILSRPITPSITEKRIFGRIYKYTIVSTDSDGDELRYVVHWSNWRYEDFPEEGFVPQGEPVIAKHRFAYGEEHNLTVHVCDEHYLWARDPATKSIAHF